MGLDVLAPSFPKGDPVRTWPKDPELLESLAAERMAKNDWYGDLSVSERCVWELGFYRPIDQNVRTRPEAECGCELIEFARKKLGVPRDRVNKVKLSELGHKPFRCSLRDATPKKSLGWTPSHSIHCRDEVVQIDAEFRSVKDELYAQSDLRMIDEYDEQLMPALAKIIKQRRFMFCHINH